MPWTERLGMFLVGAVVGVGATLFVLDLHRSPYRIVARHGQSTPTTLRFGASPAPAPPADASTASARGVVLVIADGMGYSHLFAARAEIAGVAGRLFVEQMPVAGWMTTFADRSLYTDSASAAVAMATGRKVRPGQLAQDARGRPITTVLEAAVDRGLAAGLITDTYILDATPAAFVAHTSRRDYPRVSAHAARAGLALLAGAVIPGRPGVEEGDPFVEALTRHGMSVVRDVDAWRRALSDDARPVGLFSDDRIADPNQAPTLADLAEPALEWMMRQAQGFFLLLETEEVDTGAHDHDLGRVIGGIRTLDTVARLAVEQAAAAGDVLVIVTSDHETGGLGLLGGGEGEQIRVGWATASHTAEPVPLFAFGPGAELLAGVHDNTEIAHVIARVLALDVPREVESAP